jgi:hypothetical protein
MEQGGKDGSNQAEVTCRIYGGPIVSRILTSHSAMPGMEISDFHCTFGAHSMVPEINSQRLTSQKARVFVRLAGDFLAFEYEEGITRDLYLERRDLSDGDVYFGGSCRIGRWECAGSRRFRSR